MGVNNAFIPSTYDTSNSPLVCPAYGKSNPGYGWGYYIEQPYYSLYAKFIWDDPKQFGTFAMFTISNIVGKNMTVCQDHSTPDTRKNINIPNETEAKLICMKGLSDAFEMPISMINPVFPLYEALDSGVFTFDLGFVADGYAYESGTRGGGAGAMVEEFKIFAKKGSAETTIADVKLADQLMLNTYTATLSAGEQICLKVSKYGGSAVRYSIFYFGHSVPGWKEATT